MRPEKTRARGQLRLSACSLAVALLGDAAQVGAHKPGPVAGFQRSQPARILTSLDTDWRFRRGDEPTAVQPGFDDRTWDYVTLPHTFNGADGDDGGGYYRGPGWYRRTLVLRKNPGRRLWIQFDGAALAAVLYVNGRVVGHHEGGYAAFRFDVTDALKPGVNMIAVRVDNGKRADIAPLGGDFTVFGGLYRHVWLIETDPLHISLSDYGGPGVFLTTRALDADAARVEARALLENDTIHARRFRVRVTLRDSAGQTVARAERPMHLAPRSSDSLTLPVVILRPHLWRGRADPYLYAATVEILLDDGVATDAITVPFGVRTIAFDPQRGFVLSGQPYAMHGVDLFHSGRPGRGLAVTEQEIDADMQTLDELGANALRMVHFQHPPLAYDEADRRGFVVWTEIGLNGVIDPSQGFEDNATQQMRELIRQNYNHPSIALWGIGNEIYAVDPDVMRVLRAVNAVAKTEDPTRPTVYAHCCQSDDNDKAAISDVIGFNRYFGWYPGQTGSIGSWADTYHAAHPGRAFAVSEYGAGASIRQQQLPPPLENQPNSGWHPEQAQTRYHELNWRELRTRPYLFGTFVWVAFDLASDGRHEGDRPGINDKGLVSYDRAVRKDAYYWYQANWTAAPMIHITDRRLDRRDNALVEVRAFSNAARAVLRVNGREIGTAPVIDHEVRWAAVQLDTGTNRIAVAAESGAAMDEVFWTVSQSSALGATPLPSAQTPAASSGRPGQ